MTRGLRLVHPDTPALGLIVLRVDETLEGEARTALPASRARLHISRIPSGDDLTPASIGAMADTLTAAAALLPAAADFDVVAYACTSGAAQLGPETVARLVRAGVPTRAVTDPLSAAVARIEALGLERIGIVSPYTADVAATLWAAFAARGVTVVDAVSLDQSDEATVARIDPQETADLARELVRRTRLDGVFLSCTNLRTAGILDPLAADLGMPVLSSNQCLCWHMRALAGIGQHA